MDLEKESEWILVENLRKEELQLKQKKEIDESDKGNDFGSYRWLLNHGIAGSGIEKHNIIDYQAYLYGIILTKIIKKYFFKKNPRDIADVGCGTGFVTNELKRNFPSCRVIGYDLAQDAIEYAKRHFLNPEFHCLGLEPITNLGIKFDLIHSREFYPFTRTKKLQFYTDYLNLFSRHLKEEGIIILNLRQTEYCLVNALKELKPLLPAMGFTSGYHKIVSPNFTIYSIIRNVPISSGITYLVKKYILRKINAFFIIFKKC